MAVKPQESKDPYNKEIGIDVCYGCRYIYMEALRRGCNACTCQKQQEPDKDGKCPMYLGQRKRNKQA